MRHWYELLGELETARGLHRWFGHEYAAAADAEAVGPERVTVVVLDRADHGFAFRAFAGLLDLPSGLLAAAPVPAGTNRSLGVPEVELLRRLNQSTRAHGTGRPTPCRWTSPSTR
jgi:hypothetical protein